jgi:hypothetical protein
VNKAPVAVAVAQKRAEACHNGHSLPQSSMNHPQAGDAEPEDSEPHPSVHHKRASISAAAAMLLPSCHAAVCRAVVADEAAP